MLQREKDKSLGSGLLYLSLAGGGINEEAWAGNQEVKFIVVKITYQLHISFFSITLSSIWQILLHLESRNEQENICGWKVELVIQAFLRHGEDGPSPSLNKQLPPASR